MAAKRLLSGGISVFENPVWKKQAVLSTRRLSSEPYNGGSKWIAKAFISTATVAAGSVLVLEYVPEAQESVDQLFPGFKEGYGRRKGKVASWYRKAAEYASGTGKAPSKSQESASTERAKMKVQDKPLKQQSPKPSSVQPSPSSSKENKQPSGQQNALKRKAEANQTKEVPNQKKDATAPVLKKESTSQKDKSLTKVQEKDKKEDPGKKVPVPPQPSEKTVPASVPPAALKEALKPADTVEQQRAAIVNNLDGAMKEYSSIVQSACQSNRSYADTMKGLSQELSHAGEQSVSFQQAMIALNAAKEQTSAIQEGFQETTKEYGDAKTMLECAVQSAVSANLHKEAEKGKHLLVELGGEMSDSREDVCNSLALSKPLLESVEVKVARVREKVGLLEAPSSPEEVEQLQTRLVVSQEQNDRMKLQIQGLEARDEDMVSQALQLQEDEIEKLVQGRLDAVVDDQKQEHRKMLELQAFDLESVYELKLHEQIKRQLILQTEEMQVALDRQRQDLQAKYSQELSETVTEVNSTHQLELARAKSHLQAVDSMIDSISGAGQEVKRQQELRAACETLNKAIKRADHDEGAETHSFSRELSALKTAASDDNFIASVLDNLSVSFVQSSDDVSSRSSLYDRFDKVQALCHRVALVPEHGGMGSYLTSAVASVFTFNTLPYNTIDRATPLDQMDTYQLLHQAEAYVNHGNLEMATRCMNQLKGEPRRVARDWLQDARLYLETAQAARVVTEYIAASSVSTSSLL